MIPIQELFQGLITLSGGWHYLGKTKPPFFPGWISAANLHYLLGITFSPILRCLRGHDCLTHKEGGFWLLPV